MSVLEVACPGCHAALKAPDSMAGKKAKCKKCGVTFRIPGGASTGDTVGEDQLLSTVDLPAPAAPAANPFDFAAPAAPPPKKSGAVPKPAQKETPPAAKSTPKAPVPTTARSTPEAKAPARPAPPKPLPVEDLPEAADDTAPPAGVADDTVPPGDPFAFASGSGKPAANKGKPKGQPSAPVSPAPADPFAFAPGTDDAAEAEAEEPAPPAKDRSSRSQNRHSDKPARPARQQPRVGQSGSGVGKLVLVVAVFGLVVGGIVGGVLLFLNSKKDVEQAKVEKKDDKKEAEPAPAEPAPKKGEQKDAATAPAKDAPKAAANRSTARVRNAAAQTAAAGPLALPAGVRAIQFQAEPAKRELIQEPATKLALSPDLGPKADAAYPKARRVFPPLKREIDPGVLWQAEAGFQGRGEKLLLGLYSPQTGKQVNALAVDGDGSADPVCDLSVSADDFIHAHTADGKVSIWKTRDGKKVVDGFAPYARKGPFKDAKIAAVYLTEPPDRFVTVSTAGAVHVFDVATQTPVGEFVPPKPPATPVVAGKAVVPGPGRASVVMVVGGTLYRVKVRDALVTGEAVGDLGGDLGRALGLAASGDGKLSCVFETSGEKKEKAVMLIRSDDKHQMFRWPDAAGDPVSAGWCGDQLASIGTSRGSAVWFVSEGETFKPLALVRTPADKGMHIPSDDHWSLIPDPADAKKCLLIALASPQQAFESALEAAKKEPPTVRLDEKGLFK